MKFASNYPASARYAALMAQSLGLKFEDLDRGNGYIFRVGNERKSFVCGAGLICSYPVNNATSHEIARDKSHTKTVLDYSKIPTITGKLFFLDQRYSKLQPKGHTLQDAEKYAESIGFPVFCKPNKGARGDYAQIVFSAKELSRYLDDVQKYYDSILIEEVVDLTEYRVLVFMGEPVYQVKKTSPKLTGDGASDVSDLLDLMNSSIEGVGLSPFKIESLEKYSTEPNYVMRDGETVRILGRQNISSHGSFEEFHLNPKGVLVDIAREAAQALNLEVAAVDIFYDADTGMSKVIEVNSNPNITALEKAGHLDIVIKLWGQIAKEMLK
jgi:D-alanine-D-alanine ligase-like ATP-grasp enzyme